MNKKVALQRGFCYAETENINLMEERRHVL